MRRTIPPSSDVVKYCRLDLVSSASSTSTARSPCVFLHGWPDSPELFRAYLSAEERENDWLVGRDLYTIAFPNRRTNPVLPPFRVLVVGQLFHHGGLQREIDALLDALAKASPTHKIIIVAHDWGATCAWSWIRRRPEPPVEVVVSLSVGSSFRYDFGEHGVNAIQWIYSAILSLGYYVPHRLIGRLFGAMVKPAGYRSDDLNDVYRDNWHYFYGPAELLAMPLKLLGLLRYEPGFINFAFPVLFLRSPSDRLATTAAFEAHLRDRSDCHLVILPDDTNHWFPEQNSSLVLSELRTFPPLLLPPQSCSPPREE